MRAFEKTRLSPDWWHRQRFMIPSTLLEDRNPLKRRARSHVSVLFCTVGVLTLCGFQSAHAADQTWKTTGFTDGNWDVSNNWVGGAVPGFNSTGGLNSETATFNGANNTTVTVDATRSIKSILFDTANAGAFTLQTGSLYLTNTGSISISSTVLNTETINSPIFLSANAGATTYSFTNNSTASGVSLNINGNITGRMTASTETITVNGAGSGQISGNIVDGTGGGNVALTKAGAGTWTLSGNNTYTGATTISGGTLLLGASNRIADTSPIILSGGTLNLNGNSEGAAGANGVGALTLTADSTIDFGSGGLIQFGANVKHILGSGNDLSIINWNGTPFTGGGTERLLFAGNTTDSLSFSSRFQQNEVSFNGISGYAAVQFSGFYEIVAVPEPSGVVVTLGLFGLIGWRERRRMQQGRAIERQAIG